MILSDNVTYNFLRLLFHFNYQNITLVLNVKSVAKENLILQIMCYNKEHKLVTYLWMQIFKGTAFS